MADPNVLGLVLSTRDHAQLARQVQHAVDRASPEVLFLHPGARPGAPAVIDLAGLWDAIRAHDQPWATTEPDLLAHMALAVLVLTGGSGRVKTCVVPDCRHVFVDPTNATNRTHCSRHLRTRTAREGSPCR